MDQEIIGVDGIQEEIPGVNNAKGTPGMGDQTPGVDDEVDDEPTPVVDDDAPHTTNTSDEADIEQTNVERMSGAINLRRQPRKEYNSKNHDTIFSITKKN